LNVAAAVAAFAAPASGFARCPTTGTDVNFNRPAATNSAAADDIKTFRIATTLIPWPRAFPNDLL
jgi:hypothetical protein